MWVQKLCILIFPVLSMGMRRETAVFSANYFQRRDVQFVCLLSCETMTWDVEFTKAAASYSISVSSVNTAHSSFKDLKKCLRHYFHPIGVLINVKCSELQRIFYTASINRWLDFYHIWLVIDETETSNLYTNETTDKVIPENTTRFLQTLTGMNISVDADIILASREGNQFQLADVFNFGRIQGGTLITTNIGLWKPNEENEDVFVTLNGYKYYRRYDFKQLGIRTVLVYLPSSNPQSSFDPEELLLRPIPGVDLFTRTSFVILLELARVHNIRLVYTLTDRYNGYYHENISAKACSAALHFEEQDVSAAFRYLDSLVHRITLIPPSLTSIEISYLYRISTTGPGKFENQFLRPLSVGTWLTLLVISLVCTVILVATSRWESRPTSLQFAFFSVTAIICQQFFEDDAYDMSVKRISTARKLSTFVIGISGVLVYNFYTSSVVSWLLNGPPPSITSLRGLADSSLELIYENTGYVQFWLAGTKYYFNPRNAEIEDVIRQIVLTRKRKMPLFMPLEEGIAMVKAGGYAYMTEPYRAYPLISATFDKSEQCELGILASIEKVHSYAGVQRNSPYKEFFTWSLTRLLEKGIVSCMRRRTIPGAVSCDGKSPRALALGGAAPAFVLLAGGYLLAAAIMIVERIVYKIQQRRSLKLNILENF